MICSRFQIETPCPKFWDQRKKKRDIERHKNDNKRYGITKKTLVALQWIQLKLFNDFSEHNKKKKIAKERERGEVLALCNKCVKCFKSTKSYDVASRRKNILWLYYHSRMNLCKCCMNHPVGILFKNHRF